MRVEDVNERLELAALAGALERRDLTVSSGPADGAAAILRSGIGQVASLVETIHSTVAELSETSQRVSAASVESERSSEEIAGAVNMVASVTEQQARLIMEAGNAAGEAAAAVARALSLAEAADAALSDAERGMITADDAHQAMVAVEESAAAIMDAASALVSRSGEITG